MRFEGKIALITGAGGKSSIGGVTACQLAREGAHVVMTDVDTSALGSVCDEIIASGGKGAVVPHDVTDEQGWAEIVSQIEADIAPIDILVNAAGVLLSRRPIQDITADDFRRVMDVNANGVFLGLRAVLPRMADRGNGCVVNISSITCLGGNGGLSPYAASKSAVRQLSRAAAVVYGPAGVRVNAIFPGLIATPMTSWMDADAQNDLVGMQCLKKAGHPQDVANAVCFLVSEDASFITGAELVVDGGVTAH